MENFFEVSLNFTVFITHLAKYARLKTNQVHKYQWAKYKFLVVILSIKNKYQYVC